MTPLVLLHGFTGSPRSFAPVLARIELGRPALAVTLIGHDREWTDQTSRSPSVAGTFEAEVDRIARLVEQSAHVSAHLVGYSLGARIALGLLLRHPRLFSRATLIAPHAGLRDRSEREARVLLDEHWCRLLETQGIEAFVDAWQAQALFATQTRLPAEQQQTQRRERLSHAARGLAHSLRTTGLGQMPSYWQGLESLEVPLRLLVGELDQKFRPLCQNIAEIVPRAELQLVSAAGHNVLLERPDAVVEALLGETRGSPE